MLVIQYGFGKNKLPVGYHIVAIMLYIQAILDY